MQIGVVSVVIAIVVLATPTGLFLRAYIPSQVRSLVELVPTDGGMEGRRLRALGGDYRFLALVRDHTPEDAVILMSDQHAPSTLDLMKAKHQGWATHVLYPRTVLYLHQDEQPRYRDAEYLIVDGEAAVYWIEPSRRPPVEAKARFVRFDMGNYLDGIEAGTIDERYRPPSRPLRGTAR